MYRPSIYLPSVGPRCYLAQNNKCNIMKKKIRRILKWTSISIVSLVVLVICFGFWFMSLIPEMDQTLETSMVKDIPYLSEDIVPFRGKILAVVTSTDIMGDTDKSTGYELTELARAYYVFKANGFEVDIASPLGGKPPVVIDDDDMGVFDFAFLNDTEAQQKANNTRAIHEVNPEEYDAIFFAGGKGAMFDFPENKAIPSDSPRLLRIKQSGRRSVSRPSGFGKCDLKQWPPSFRKQDCEWLY